jgi:hypothetical protein
MSNSSLLNKGIYIPKSFLSNTYQKSRYNTPSFNSSNQFGGGVYGGGAPPVDWGFLFNLGIFSLFICSLFYICLYRYRNKERLRKETELKQKKLVYEFKKALEEQNRNAQQMRYNQIMQNKRQNQIMVSSKMDDVRLDFHNPYRIDNNNLHTPGYGVNFTLNNGNISANDNYNNYSMPSINNEKKLNGYEMMYQSYKINDYQPISGSSPFMNQNSLMHY